MLGPIDFIVVGFEGNNFKGEALEELAKAVDKGIIRVIALSLVAKDIDGNVTEVDLNNNGDSATLSFVQKSNLHNELVTDDDIQEVGEGLDNNTAAGLLVIEHLWAIGFKSALLNAGGSLIAEGRLHPEVTKELQEEL
jgi:hypothetical protein